MVKIQVLGKGLIPRGYGIAPRKEPFPADTLLIQTILNTPGLSMNFISPQDGRAYPLTKENYQRIIAKYGSVDYSVKPTEGLLAPHVPEEKKPQVPPTPVKPVTDEVKADPKPEVKSDTNNVPETKTEEASNNAANANKDNTKAEASNGPAPIKPMNAPEEKKNNNGGNNNKK